MEEHIQYREVVDVYPFFHIWLLGKDRIDVDENKNIREEDLQHLFKIFLEELGEFLGAEVKE